MTNTQIKVNVIVTTVKINRKPKKVKRGKRRIISDFARLGEIEMSINN